MNSVSLTDAVPAAPNDAGLLDRHAKWCAQMCRNLPSAARKTCRNLPSQPPPNSPEPRKTCQNVLGPAGTCHRTESGETNPSAYRPTARPLNDRQLTAALLMVRGHGSVDIARALGVNRHTVAVWKQNPAFAIEVQRLRAYVTASVVTQPPVGATRQTAVPPLRPAPPAAPPPRRMTRREIEREDRECEAMIAQMLGGCHTERVR